MPFPRLGLFLSLTLVAVQLTSGQTVVNSVFAPHGEGYYGDANNWSPPEVPNNSPEKSYNVTIPSSQIRLNVDATISNLALTGTLTAEDHALTVIGSTTLEDFGINILSSLPEGATFAAGSMSSFSGGSLTGKYYLSNYNTTAGWATLQFNGADITALSNAQLALWGPLTRIVDEFGNEALRDLSHIDSDSSLQLVGHQLAIAGPLTNDGQLSISAGFNQASLFSILGTLTNLDTTSRTLTGGTYYVGGSSVAGSNQTAVFQFAGADIVHNAATIGISGSLAKITDQNGNDAFRNFAHNTLTGVFSVSNRDFSIGGNFTNDGLLALWFGTFTVEGSLTNFDPATRTLTGGTYQLDGDAGAVSFVFSGADIVNNAASIYLKNSAGISDQNGNDALRNFSHNLQGGEFTIHDYHVFTPPSDFTNAGVVNILGDPPTVNSPAHFKLTGNHNYRQTEGATYFASTLFAGDMAIDGGSFSTASLNAFFSPASQLDGNLTIGDALFSPRALDVEGAVHLSPSSRFFTSLQGTTVGFFTVTETFTAGGTLQIASQQFPPPSTSTYSVVQSGGGVIGTFSNAPHGGRIPTSDGRGSFVVSYASNAIYISGYQAIPPAAQLLNISTRAHVRTSNNVAIAGFIVFGQAPKTVIIRGLGPSLSGSGVGGSLQNPTLELHAAGGATIATNDNWQDSQAAEIQESGFAPSDARESAIIATLTPGAYTTVLAGENSTIGIGLVEVYDLAREQSKIANISTRGFVDPQDVLIGGFIAGGSGEGNAEVVVRAIGPLLNRAGITGFLPDPTLELVDGQGNLLAFNDDFNDAPENFERIPASLRMFNAKDAALPAALPPGNYTAIVRGKNGASGIALVEVYDLNR